MTNRNKNFLFALLLGAIALVPVYSYAAGFQINENSPRLQGQAMAGSGADAGEISAIFANPALIGTIKKSQMYAGVSYIDPTISMKNATAVHGAALPGLVPPGADIPTDPVPGATQQHNVAESAFVPALYSVTPIDSQFSVGLSITAPWGLPTNYHADSVVRFMAQKTAMQSINISPALSYHINKEWVVAAGVQAENSSVDFSNYDGTIANTLPAESGVLPTTAPTQLNASGWGYGYTLGVLFTPYSGTHFGLSYRSQVDSTLRGHGEQITRAKNQDLEDDEPFNAAVTTKAKFNTPAVLNFSAQQQINSRWTVDSTIQITDWNSLQSLTIDTPQGYAKSTTLTLNWKDSFLYALGANYQLNKQWSLRTGIAYDETPTNDVNRDARIPDTNRTWTTLGASYQLNSRFRVDAAYEHIFMQPQSIDVTENVGENKYANPLEVNTVTADYTGSANIFALGLKYQF